MSKAKESVSTGGQFKHIGELSVFLDNAKNAFRTKFSMKFQNKGNYTLQNFLIKRTLGAGSFGTVYSVTNDVTGRSYAMKAIKKKAVVEKKQVRNAYLEKRVLQSLQFPFVVNLRFFFMDSAHLYYLMPLALGGEMYRSLTICTKFDNDLCRFYGAQILLALEYLHYLNLIFRDLKTENVVIFHTGYVKITDFGFCKVVTGRTYSFCGTPEYMAPEILLNKGYGKSVDWWAYGILLYEMGAGYTPFRAEKFKNIYRNILRCNLKFPDYMSLSLRHLIHQLVQPDLTRRYGNLRAGVMDIKRHHWFKGFNWKGVLNQELIPPFKPPIKSINQIGKPFNPDLLDDQVRKGKYSAVFKEF